MDRMKIYVAVVVVTLLGFENDAALAQLSPGELATAHAKLEGLSNCTQCHELGKHISNGKCLDCHNEIRTRVEIQAGYHATVRDSACVTCHSDHNGRNFEMIRWPNEDMRAFDHTLTGYVLEGKHQRADCRKCHQTTFTSDACRTVRSPEFLSPSSKWVSNSTEIE